MALHYEGNQQDALYRLIYYSKLALHVSSNVFAHNQEHFTVFLVYGGVHPSSCRLVIPSWLYMFRVMFSPIIRSALLYL